VAVSASAALAERKRYPVIREEAPAGDITFSASGRLARTPGEVVSGRCGLAPCSAMNVDRNA